MKNSWLNLKAVTERNKIQMLLSIPKSWSAESNILALVCILIGKCLPLLLQLCNLGTLICLCGFLIHLGSKVSWKSTVKHRSSKGTRNLEGNSHPAVAMRCRGGEASPAHRAGLKCARAAQGPAQPKSRRGTARAKQGRQSLKINVWSGLLLVDQEPCSKVSVFSLIFFLLLPLNGISSCLFPPPRTSSTSEVSVCSQLEPNQGSCSHPADKGLFGRNNPTRPAEKALGILAGGVGVVFSSPLDRSL